MFLFDINKRSQYKQFKQVIKIEQVRSIVLSYMSQMVIGIVKLTANN